MASSVCLSPVERGFDRGVPVGDPSLREVAGDVATADLEVRSPVGPDASAADASAANLDRNLALALERLREAVADGRLGELNRRHLALCGAVASTTRAIRKRAPRAAEWLSADRVDVALLVPT